MKTKFGSRCLKTISIILFPEIKRKIEIRKKEIEIFLWKKIDNGLKYIELKS